MTDAETDPNAGLPLGYRLHNPGDIRADQETVWRGQVDSLEGFCRFTGPQWGLRAMMLLLRNYQVEDGLKTIREIVNRYAPPSENDTGTYIENVSSTAGLNPDAAIDLTAKPFLQLLCRAMVRQELGRPPQSLPVDWYTDQTYDLAYTLLPLRT